MENILILCTGNSCRSQIAHGYLQQLMGDRAAVYSAGVQTHGVNPRAIQVMEEDGVDISGHSSNHVNEYLIIPFHFVITVCDHAKEVCPVFPVTAEQIHQSFSDPAKAQGSEEEILQAFRAVRDEIKAFCQDFANKNNGIKQELQD